MDLSDEEEKGDRVSGKSLILSILTMPRLQSLLNFAQ
jgi:hypothetical protein